MMSVVDHPEFPEFEIIESAARLVHLMPNSRRQRKTNGIGRKRKKSALEWRLGEAERFGDRHIEYISESKNTLPHLPSSRSTRPPGELVMEERFQGEVTDESAEAVSVMYDTPHGLVEHVYHRDQFIAHRLSRVGDEITARTQLFANRPEPRSLADVLREGDDTPFVDFSAES